MTRIFTHLLTPLCAAWIVAACGGGGDSASDGSPPPGDGSNQQRIQAATATAQNNALCTAIRPFYWEIGDRTGTLASGSVHSGSSSTVYTSDSLMSIASASKWIYSTYVAQKRGGVLTTEDYKYLNFQSGYTTFDQCLPGQTIAECDAYENNGDYTAANDGKFFYDGGHMEKHAVLMGLGPMNNATLATEIRSQLGADVAVSYSQPQLAGGAFLTPSTYALALRKMLTGELLIGSMLGTHAVCTSPAHCAAAVFAPIPPSEQWHYSIGHWVEDDPNVGDGAFSSPGAFGFYPWIDASKTYYGVLARSEAAGAFDSVYCGRLVRKAWVTGVAQ